MNYFSLHNHSDYSNIRLLDSINKTKGLIDQALKYNLAGVALTDHEVLSGHVEFLDYYNKIKKDNPNFKIGLGNEIYLVDERKNRQKYYHFILIAKNTLGHRALRELSSNSWYNSYFDRGMERVPTLKSELKQIVEKYPNTLIATTACLGGELPHLVSELIRFERSSNTEESDINNIKFEIDNYITFMKDLFNKDFYIEIAPGASKAQIDFNKRIVNIANYYNVDIVVATDSHYLTKEDRFVHKSYLNSQNGEREVDDFYEFCYMMTNEEIINYLKLSYKDSYLIDAAIKNTLKIYDSIEEYNLFRNPVIPIEKVAYYYPIDGTEEYSLYPSILEMLKSDSEQDRYWVNICLEALEEKGLKNHIYLDRLNTEADVILFISDNLKERLTAYFNTLRSYINLFWESGSIVGPGRGSAVGFLSNYLLGITQIDPIKYNLPWFRFLNKERAELPKQYWAV